MSQISINTAPYRNAYGKTPRGRGGWVFEIHCAGAIHYYWHNGLYSEAARAVIKEARTYADFRKLVLGA